MRLLPLLVGIFLPISPLNAEIPTPAEQCASIEQRVAMLSNRNAVEEARNSMEHGDYRPLAFVSGGLFTTIRALGVDCPRDRAIGSAARHDDVRKSRMKSLSLSSNAREYLGYSGDAIPLCAKHSVNELYSLAAKFVEAYNATIVKEIRKSGRDVCRTMIQN